MKTLLPDWSSKSAEAAVESVRIQKLAAERTTGAEEAVSAKPVAAATQCL
jgi:hypothetical protein